MDTQKRGTVLYGLISMEHVRLYELPTGLSDGAKALVTDLARRRYVRSHTMKIEHSNGKRIMQKDICEITGRSKPTVSKSIKELEEEHVIAYDGRDFYFNPLYVRAGRELASSYTLSLFPNSRISKEYRDDDSIDFEKETDEERTARQKREEQFRREHGIELPY